MTYKVEKSLKDFDFWSGAIANAKNLTNEEFDTIESYLEESGELMTETEINDFFWFDMEFWATEILGTTEDEILNRE